MEYISFPGHVFSISSVCWYSSASEESERRIVRGARACQLVDNPGRIAIARNLYVTIAPPKTGVPILDGSEPPIWS